MLFAVYWLVIAAFLLAVNLRTYRSAVAKQFTYVGMWLAVLTSITTAIVAMSTGSV